MNDSVQPSAKRAVLAIIGSASEASSNLRLVQHIASVMQERFQFTVYDKLQQLPHFNPELSLESTPQIILDLRSKIDAADAVLICTPEYIFSLPSGLKNVFEWCVAVTVFSGKPVGLITASAHGVQGHEELKRIVKTIEGRFTEETTLLIQGIKGKLDADGNLKDEKTKVQLESFVEAFAALAESHAR